MFITPTGFVILVGLGLLGLWLFVELGSLPGKKAAEREHPQAEAINILGWLGLLFGAVGWMVALVWAYTKPALAAAGPGPAVAEAGADLSGTGGDDAVAGTAGEVEGGATPRRIRESDRV